MEKVATVAAFFLHRKKHLDILKIQSDYWTTKWKGGHEMLNEEQKKQIRQMAADGVGYRETLKYVLASRQDIIDYRTELVEKGGLRE